MVRDRPVLLQDRRYWARARWEPLHQLHQRVIVRGAQEAQSDRERLVVAIGELRISREAQRRERARGGFHVVDRQADVVKQEAFFHALALFSQAAPGVLERT